MIRRLPFLQSYSGYHSIMVPFVLLLLYLLITEAREYMLWFAFGDIRGTIVAAFVLVVFAYAFKVGVQQGKRSKRDKRWAMIGLVFFQFMIGMALGMRVIIDGEHAFSSMIGWLMILLGLGRIVIWKLHQSVERYFVDFRLGSVELVTSAVTLGLIISSAILFHIGPLLTISTTYLVADALTAARSNSFSDTAD